MRPSAASAGSDTRDTEELPIADRRLPNGNAGVRFPIGNWQSAIGNHKEMEKPNVFRHVVLFVSVAVWAFMLLALGSFHTSDWPSHQVYPHPPLQNLCGKVGAYVAYHVFVVLGQGVFPILFFSGVCLGLLMFKGRVGDWWLRTVGLLVMTVAFAAIVHNVRPGSAGALPEGHGGLVGIGTSTFLQQHFSTVGTRLILLTGLLIGLLLVADDLVLRTPGMVGQAIVHVKKRTPDNLFRGFKFPPLPKLPSLPKFVTTDALRPRAFAA